MPMLRAMMRRQRQRGARLRARSALCAVCARVRERALRRYIVAATYGCHYADDITPRY